MTKTPPPLARILSATSCPASRPSPRSEYPWHRLDIPTIPVEGADSCSHLGEGSRMRDQVFSGVPVFIPSGGSIRAEFCWDELYGLTVALYSPYRCRHIEDREGESIAT